MRECKLRSGGNRQGKLKQRGVKRKGVKAGLGVQVKFLQAELECDRCSVVVVVIIIITTIIIIIVIIPLHAQLVRGLLRVSVREGVNFVVPFHKI